MGETNQAILLAGKLAAAKSRLDMAVRLLDEIKTTELVPGDEPDPAVGECWFCVFCDEVVGVCDTSAACLGARIRAFVAVMRSLRRPEPPSPPETREPTAYVTQVCERCHDEGWISVPDGGALFGQRPERCPIGCPDEIERAQCAPIRRLAEKGDYADGFHLKWGLKYVSELRRSLRSLPGKR